MEANDELLPCIKFNPAVETVREHSFCPESAKEAACEHFPGPDLAMEANHELLSCSNPAEEAAFRLSALSVTAEEAVCEHCIPVYHCQTHARL